MEDRMEGCKKPVWKFREKDDDDDDVVRGRK